MQAVQVVAVEGHPLVHHFCLVALELRVKVLLEALVVVEVASHTVAQAVAQALLVEILWLQINRELVVELVV
jgi:phage-related holin